MEDICETALTVYSPYPRSNKREGTQDEAFKDMSAKIRFPGSERSTMDPE